MGKEKGKRSNRKADRVPDNSPDTPAGNWFTGKTGLAVLLLAVVIVVVAVVFGSQIMSPPPSTGAVPGTVTVWYFYGNGCDHCIYVTPLVYSLRQKYPDVDFRIFEIYNNTANRDVLISMNRKYGQKDSGIPIAFVNNVVLFGGDEIPQRLEKVIIDQKKLTNSS